MAAGGSAAKGAEEVQPEIYYIPDKDGKLRAAYLDRITFEEFKQRLSEMAERVEAPPSFVLNSMSVTGAARDGQATLQVELAVQNRQEGEGNWVRIPLRLGSAILPLNDAAKHEGPGEFFLHFDRAAQGYVGWLRGGSRQEHRITLNLVVPLQQVGDESRVELTLPRATRSLVQLTVQGSNITAEVSAGATLQPPRAGSDETELVVAGAAGAFWLNWRPQAVAGPQRVEALEVEGAQVIHIEGGQIRAEVNLRVQSFAGTFDRFRVTLPAGARLISQSQPGYSLVASLPPDDRLGNGEPVSDKEASWVDVRLEEPTSGPFDIRLVTQQIRDDNRPDDVLQLGGFAVENALRQSGYVVVQVDGDWSVRWEENFADRFDIHRVDQWPEMLPQENVVAGFRYYRQPYSLKAKIVPPTTSIAVESENLIRVSAGVARLTSRLKCQVRGRKIDKLTIQLSGWQLIDGSIAPIDLLDDVQPPSQSSDLLVIPVARSVKREFTVDFEARIPIDSLSEAIACPLPQPQVDRLGSTLIAVLPDDNIELALRGLGEPVAGVPSGWTLALPELQQPPTYFAFARGEKVPANLAADVKVRTLVIDTEVKSKVHLSRRSVDVQQTLAFDIAHERIDSVILDVPSALAETDNLVVTRDDQPLVPVPVDDAADGASDQTVPMRISLKSAIGRVQLVVKFRKDLEPLSHEDHREWIVPLVMPASGTCRSNVVDLTADDAIEANASDPWKAAEAGELRGDDTPDDPERLARYYAETAQGQLSLIVGLTDRATSGSIVIQRAWLQTWFTENARYDRAVFRFTSRAAVVELTLPAAFSRDHLEIVLDDQMRAPDLSADGRLRINLTDVPDTHVLQLRYYLPRPAPSGMMLGCDFPRFVNDAYLREPMFWQLILPVREHLVSAPETCVPAYRWGWHRFGWRRIPFSDEAELARWVGVPLESSPLEERAATSDVIGQNIYLFQVREVCEAVNVAVISRTILVLAAAGVALLAGVLLIHIPRLRHGTVLLAAAIGLLAAGLIYPEPVLLAAQMAVLGVVLTMLSLYLSRVLRGGRRASPVPIARSPGSSVVKSAQETFAPAAIVTVPVGSTVTGANNIGGPMADSER